ncbi:hypothetical protein CR513_18110, partial [Mucuna pruriens]
MEPYTEKLYERSYVRIIPVLYTVVDVEASYNVIIGRPVLNKLGAVVFSYHLCMKYPVGKEVGRVWVDHQVARHCCEDSLGIGSRPARADRSDLNMLDLDLNPRCEDERERPLPTKDLKEINIPTHKTKIGTTLTRGKESSLVSFL